MKTIKILPTEEVGVDEISVYGVIGKINQPILNVDFLGKHYDAVMPVIASEDTNGEMRKAIICFPHVKNGLAYADVGKEMMSFYVEDSDEWQ